MAQISDDIDETLLEKPCRFCHDLYPEIILLEHQTVCQALIEQVSYGGDIGRRNIDCAGRDHQVNTNFALNDDDVDELLIEIPCDICGQFFPTIVMVEHQAICEVLLLATQEQLIASEEMERQNRTAKESLSKSSNASHNDTTKEKGKEEVKQQTSFEVKEAIEVKVAGTKTESKREFNTLQTGGNNPQNDSSKKGVKNSPEKDIRTDQELRTGKTFVPFVSDAEMPKEIKQEKQNLSDVPRNPPFRICRSQP